MIQSDTQRLTRADVELHSGDGRGLRGLLIALSVFVPLAVGTIAFYAGNSGRLPFTLDAAAEALAEENAMLRAELERTRTELEIDQATRNELNRQVETLNDQLADLTSRLEFLTARTSLAADTH